ncbi:hypothetical protein DH09_00840 (plasmid) [Bacillaceae bacterium JMAK1]|nr:hypothetical protein DH09_00840 [Bacillaceae bacterium JMAK1]
MFANRLMIVTLVGNIFIFLLPYFGYINVLAYHSPVVFSILLIIANFIFVLLIASKITIKKKIIFYVEVLVISILISIPNAIHYSTFDFFHDSITLQSPKNDKLVIAYSYDTDFQGEYFMYDYRFYKDNGIFMIDLDQRIFISKRIDERPEQFHGTSDMGQRGFPLEFLGLNDAQWIEEDIIEFPMYYQDTQVHLN